MPALNRQTLINLLIDSPLREPIKINLIDIVNNTSDADLSKTYSTISKELEIFQKATERRMKLADETIAKLKEDGGSAATDTVSPATSAQTDSGLPPLPTAPMTPTPEPAGLSVPPLDLPPLPKMNVTPEPTPEPASPVTPPPPAPAVVPQSDASPLPPPPVQSAPATDADEDALKEIQKELDSLKSTAAEEAAPTPAAPTSQV